LKRFILLFVAIVLAVPVSVVLTFLLLPLWNWLENTHGIESVGHSGPADWCFVATFSVVVALIVAGWIYLWSAAKDK